DVLSDSPQIMQIPYESEKQFAVSVNKIDGKAHIFVKGAVEKIIPMCKAMATPSGDSAIDASAVEEASRQLAAGGYRVLAFAEGEASLEKAENINEDRLQGLTFIGMTGMIDPLRPEARQAVESCKKAGIKVIMITGDHPETAMAIARELHLAQTMGQVVTGSQFTEVKKSSSEVFSSLIRQARVFARVEPKQKLDIVKTLIRGGEFVAVTGDGANDAPALSAAQVGVA
ncbi:MAG: HAD family hydrolase, partial [Candidatus Omnitrophota bacterium]